MWCLTMVWGEDIISCIETQHWHLHGLQPMDGTGISVIVIIGWVAKHYGGKTLIELPDSLGL